MTNETELKLCPSCPLNGLYVECSDCINSFMPTTWYFEEEEEAIEAWNRRTNDDDDEMGG